MSQNFRIPERCSSKRAFAEIEADKQKIKYLDGDIERESKEMKVAEYFDSKYWTKLSEVSELQLKRSQLSLRVLRDEVTEGSAWKENEQVKRLQEEEQAHTLEAQIFRKQASRVEVNPRDDGKNRREYFMQLWTTSSKGLGITGSETGRGKRSRNTQEQFRENLIKVCRSRDPNPKADELWCPILGHFFPDDDAMRAAHIFPWTEGQVAMDEIFGREVGNVEELSDVRNGLMLSKYAEKRLADGDIVLVPDVSNAASQKEIDAWSASEPKEYKIRILNGGAKGMDMFHPGWIPPRKTWNELDGRKVQFSSDHRPRARYLYWQYCKTMLRHAWQEKGTKAEGVLMQERGKQFWGTKGPYIKKRMLLAFVEQLGHDHEALMENAMVETEDDNIPESDPSALLLASREIRRENRRYSDHGDEEDEGDEEYEESEDSSDDELF